MIHRVKNENYRRQVRPEQATGAPTKVQRCFVRRGGIQRRPVRRGFCRQRLQAQGRCKTKGIPIKKEELKQLDSSHR